MVEPLAISAAITILVKSAPHWLDSLRDTLLSKGNDFIVNQGLQQIRNSLHLDEKEQLRHLELALKNAAERGLAKFNSPQERDQYRSILSILSEPGPHRTALRSEALGLFTLDNSSNLKSLTETYNLPQRIHAFARDTPYTDVDAIPYLRVFFEALRAELYLDPLFHEQMSDIIKVRSALSMQRSLREVVTTLHQIGGTVAPNYTTEQFEQDVDTYVVHMERTFRYLKLVGVVPKDRGSEQTDPELDGIFVPPRITLHDYALLEDQSQESIFTLLDYFHCLVLLGDPGSGKSTITRHLAWSYASAYRSPISPTSSNTASFSGKPLPLRIELRRLTEDRRQRPDYDFLTYTTEVLLGRAGIRIAPQMFEQLLERKAMLLLYDGLDEVVTLEERHKLIEEIEIFAQRYPGNRILVTSRPVGYELAIFSNRLFAHASIREFDDQQIRIFLEHWYTQVLRLSPLPPDDQQELNKLYLTLKSNPGLHSLATNPLLLTVITALHRYESLPDRRVLIYDRCADILLEIWAKLRGTDIRWNDMVLSKEDQYACTAHLGFVIHGRSQGSTTDITAEKASGNLASDVTTRFMLREIEHFLEGQNFFPTVAERRAEAKRFLELIQIEAGLIVERGIDENGEALYGFVHRTFQEYFAAADVYERYLQEDNSTVITQFLIEHLHNPHWNEVILLLFGKLKRKFATVQIRHLLKGISHRSRYNDIVQQDLFFISSCLAEEVAVENDLAEFIISRLCHLVKNSSFPAQRAEALEALGSLMRTRQYANSARKELRVMLTHGMVPNIHTRTLAIQTLYTNSPIESEERRQAAQMFVELAQQPDLSFEQKLQAIQALYDNSFDTPEEQRQAAQMFVELAQQPDLSFEQAVQTAYALYVSSPPESGEQWLAALQLLKLVRRLDISFEQAVQTAYALYVNSPPESEERWRATRLFLKLEQRARFSFEQATQIAQILCLSGGIKLEEQQQAVHKFWQLAQQSDLSDERMVLIAQFLYKCSPVRSEERDQASLILWQLAQKESMQSEKRLQIAAVPLTTREVNYRDRVKAVKMILSIAQRDATKHYIEEHWEPMDIENESDTSDIPFIAELVKQEMLPIQAREEMYKILRKLLPRFDSMNPTEE